MDEEMTEFMKNENEPGLPVKDAEENEDAAGNRDVTEGGAGTEALRAELERTREELTRLTRERSLLLKGIPEDDLDYYVFKIGKLVTEEKDFDTAAKEFLKQHGTPHRTQAPRSTGASLSGKAAKPQSTNTIMNQMLRGK